VERQPDGSYTSDYINITLTTDAARTVAWMRSRGIPLVSEQTVRAAEYDGKYATAYAAPAIA
jgi:hypothetical protein